jgi:hypothetical protein
MIEKRFNSAITRFAGFFGASFLTRILSSVFFEIVINGNHLSIAPLSISLKI